MGMLRAFATASASCKPKADSCDFIPERSVKSQSRDRVPPEYYVLLCARRYAETVRSIGTAGTEDERQKAKQRLSQIREGGMIEFERERERRERPFPSGFPRR